MTSYPYNKYEQITPSYLLSVNLIKKNFDRISKRTLYIFVLNLKKLKFSSVKKKLN